MLSKRWQRHHPAVIHGGLAIWIIIAALIMQLPPALWQRLALITLVSGVTLHAVRVLNARHADKLIKVFAADYQPVARSLQGYLNAQRIPFVKRSDDDRITFTLHRRALTVVVESYPLNLPVDDRVQPHEGTKVTVGPVAGERDRLVSHLCHRLDDVFGTAADVTAGDGPRGRRTSRERFASRPSAPQTAAYDRRRPADTLQP